MAFKKVYQGVILIHSYHNCLIGKQSGKLMRYLMKLAVRQYFLQAIIFMSGVFSLAGTGACDFRHNFTVNNI